MKTTNEIKTIKGLAKELNMEIIDTKKKTVNSTGHYTLKNLDWKVQIVYGWQDNWKDVTVWDKDGKRVKHVSETGAMKDIYKLAMKVANELNII